MLKIVNDDVYGAVKNQIIAELVSYNSWRNNFIKHITGINPVSNGVVNCTVRSHNPAPLFDSRERDYLFNFLKLNMKEIDALQTNKKVDDTFVGLSGYHSLWNPLTNRKLAGQPTNGWWFGYTPVKDKTYDVVNRALTLLQANLTDVAKTELILMDKELITAPKDLGLTSEQAVIDYLNTINRRVEISECKGFTASPDEVWNYMAEMYLQDFWQNSTNNPSGMNYCSVRFYDSVGDTVAPNSLEEEMYSYLVKLTTVLEDTGIPSIVDDVSEIKIFTHSDGTYSGQGFNRTTYTYTGSFTNVTNYVQEVSDLIQEDWNSLRATTGIIWGGNPNYYSTRLEAQEIYELMDRYDPNKLIVDWIIHPRWGKAYRNEGASIDINKFKEFPVRIAVELVIDMINIWVEEDDDNFWRTSFGKFLGALIVGVLIIASIVIGTVGALLQSGFLTAIAGATFLGATLVARWTHTNVGQLFTVVGAVMAVTSLGISSTHLAQQLASEQVSTMTAGFQISKNVAGAGLAVTNLVLSLNPPDIPKEAGDDMESAEELEQLFFTDTYDAYEALYNPYDNMYENIFDMEV